MWCRCVSCVACVCGCRCLCVLMCVCFLGRGRPPTEPLPDGWIMTFHNSGIPVYLHRETRVVTWSRPYFLGSGSIRVGRRIHKTDRNLLLLYILNLFLVYLFFWFSNMPGTPLLYTLYWCIICVLEGMVKLKEYFALLKQL